VVDGDDPNGSRPQIHVVTGISSRPLERRALVATTDLDKQESVILAIVSRRFAAALMHPSRTSLELVAALAQRLDLTLSFSSIPVT